MSGNGEVRRDTGRADCSGQREEGGVTLRPTDAQDDVLAARLGAVAHEDPRKQAGRHERHANQPHDGQQQDRGAGTHDHSTALDV